MTEVTVDGIARLAEKLHLKCATTNGTTIQSKSSIWPPEEFVAIAGRGKKRFRHLTLNNADLGCGESLLFSDCE